MAQTTITNGAGARPCCVSRQYFRLVHSSPKLTTYECHGILEDGSVCGRKHHVGHSEPLKVGAATKPLGG